MPTWAEFAPCVLVAVMGLAILLLGAIDKLAKNRGNGQLKAVWSKKQNHRGAAGASWSAS
jgi:hypothetical protein